MKKLMISSAIAALLAAPVYAQTAPATPATPATPAPEAAPATPAPEITPAPDTSATTTPEVPTPGTDTTTTDMADSGPAVEVPEGYAKVDVSTISAEMLAEATVYDLEQSNVGDVAVVNTGADGKVESLVVDVGGFLGFGSRTVSIPVTEIAVLQETDGTEIMIYVDMTKEQLEALPEVNVEG